MDHATHPDNTYAIRIKDSNDKRTDHPIDAKTYWSFIDQYGKLYGKKVRFLTLENRSVSGLLDNVICTINPDEL